MNRTSNIIEGKEKWPGDETHGGVTGKCDLSFPEPKEKRNCHNLFLSHNFIYLIPELYEDKVLLVRIVSIDTSWNTYWYREYT